MYHDSGNKIHCFLIFTTQFFPIDQKFVTAKYKQRSKTFCWLCLKPFLYACSVVPRFFFVLQNKYGCPNIEPEFFRSSFVKRPQNIWGVHFRDSKSGIPIQILQILQIFLTGPPTMVGGPSVSLKHIPDICTGRTKSTYW